MKNSIIILSLSSIICFPLSDFRDTAVQTYLNVSRKTMKLAKRFTVLVKMKICKCYVISKRGTHMLHWRQSGRQPYGTDATVQIKVRLKYVCVHVCVCEWRRKWKCVWVNKFISLAKTETQDTDRGDCCSFLIWKPNYYCFFWLLHNHNQVLVITVSMTTKVLLTKYLTM